MKKATKYGIKIFQDKNLPKFYFDNFDNLIRVRQSQKKMQVETIYTFKNYMYIVRSGFFSQNKVETICLLSWGRF